MTDAIFKWESKVRDYEVDGQGIVNNATYLNYLEQTRSEYAANVGIDFAEYFKMGYYFVVTHINIEFLHSLRASDEYYVTAIITEFNEKRMLFDHAIYRKRDDKLIAKAVATTACIDIKTKKSCMPEKLKALLQSQ